MSSVSYKTVQTKPYEGQKPGTSGLRKKTKEFQQDHYLANFVQSTFDALPQDKLKGCTLVVSGDGRYYSETAIPIIVRMAAANGVGKVWIGKGGLLSTPAVSAIIRYRAGGEAFGGFILTASHNPGGPNEDFGIKYNSDNGGPALENLTKAIYERTKKISTYYISDDELAVDINKTSTMQYLVQHRLSKKFGPFTVQVIDPVDEYLKLMHKIFDFDVLKQLLARPDFTFTFDGLSGVSGPYAQRIFVQELGADPACLINCTPSPDFNGGHPDPNLTYAHALVDKMGLGQHASGDVPEFGAACDGDADRNMIVGSRFFVTPSDSVAIIAAHAKDAIPYFSRTGITGMARSMPTSAALDRSVLFQTWPALPLQLAGTACTCPVMVQRPTPHIGTCQSVAAPATTSAQDGSLWSMRQPEASPGGLACAPIRLMMSCPTCSVAKKQGLKFYETPTGWKFFGNLMDASMCNLCGEESFGTGSDHIREKDGLWAVLAWLSILAHANGCTGSKGSGNPLGQLIKGITRGSGKSRQEQAKDLVTVQDIVEHHWAQFGRNYYTRYDYEGVDSEAADKVMETLVKKQGEVTQVKSFVIDTADEFEYKDPVDGSVASHQGIRFLGRDGSRIMFRLSGTGSSGATIRMYVDKYVAPDAGHEALSQKAEDALEALVKVALTLSDIAKITGRDKPTVIT